MDSDDIVMNKAYKQITDVTYMKGLMTMVKGLHKKLELAESCLAECSGGGGGGLENQTDANKKTPDNPCFIKRITDKFCWTHESKDCTCKASGHKDTATIGNNMGVGEDALCLKG